MQKKTTPTLQNEGTDAVVQILEEPARLCARLTNIEDFNLALLNFHVKGNMNRYSPVYARFVLE